MTFKIFTTLSKLHTLSLVRDIENGVDIEEIWSPSIERRRERSFMNRPESKVIEHKCDSREMGRK